MAPPCVVALFLVKLQSWIFQFSVFQPISLLLFSEALDPEYIAAPLEALFPMKFEYDIST